VQTLAPSAPPSPEAVTARPARFPLARIGPVLCWAGPAILSVFIFSYQAARPGPWRDELATWSAATRTVPQIWALGQHIDGVTVPYYLLVHVFAGWFGDSILALRVPSIIAMTGTVAVAALLGRRLWGTRAGLFAGLLLAVLPVSTRYAQEARGYAFAALFATCATLLLAAAQDGSRWWRWLAYGGSVLLLGWSHQIALLVLLGHAVAVLVVAGRRLLWWLLSVLVALAGVLPFALMGLGQRGTQLDWLEAAKPADLADIVGNVFGYGILGGAVCVLAALAVRGQDGWALTVFLSAALPIGVLYTIDQLVTPMFVGRYLFFVAPLVCVLAGRALAAVSVPVALGVIVVLGLIGLPQQEEFRRAHSGFDYRQAAYQVSVSVQPGDGLIYAPRDGWQFTDLAVHYYLGSAAPRDVLLRANEIQNESLWSTECADAGECLVGTDRVWTLSADNLETGRRAGATDQLTFAEQRALALFDQVSTVRVDGFTLAYFVRRPLVPVVEEPTSAYRHYGPGVAVPAGG